MFASRFRAFTLIELLIVVAIIAILAAIAVPNFLEAQVRAKVSRGKTDMRSMATALEAYRVDETGYPPDFQFYQGLFGGGSLNDRFAYAPLGRLTTPIAYMTSLPYNVFAYEHGWYDGDPQWYGYKSEELWRKIILGEIAGLAPNSALRNPATGQIDADMSKMWILLSVGPDQTTSFGEYAMFGEQVIDRVGLAALPQAGNAGAIYDSTNGTISVGDLVRTGP